MEYLDGTIKLEKLFNDDKELIEQWEKAVEEERQRYIKAHKKKSWFMTLMREAVWKLGKWKTKALPIASRSFCCVSPRSAISTSTRWAAWSGR